jgi:hypothetical protein
MQFHLLAKKLIHRDMREMARQKGLSARRFEQGESVDALWSEPPEDWFEELYPAPDRWLEFEATLQELGEESLSMLYDLASGLKMSDLAKKYGYKKIDGVTSPRSVDEVRKIKQALKRVA